VRLPAPARQTGARTDRDETSLRVGCLCRFKGAPSVRAYLWRKTAEALSDYGPARLKKANYGCANSSEA